ncbi:MAG: hypothetical protein JWS10_3325 [Cypionkella sp.]|uniref:pyocin activator PrtN family protein n=1 Tax=Cypionkella sp. TaxID=2811411 RepID=UPI0026339827|nr:pyocin activator PrtN family protein [Cypionkella sp.]MDB5660710.1 hypothetical protein [Cypionkella sp.]
MITQWALLGRYEGLPIIPVDTVIADFFPTMKRDYFLRKVAEGAIALPLVKMEASQKGAKGVHIADLAAYIDARHAMATAEHNRMHH